MKIISLSIVRLKSLLAQVNLESFQEAAVPVSDFIEIYISAVGTIHRAYSFALMVDSSFEIVRRSFFDFSKGDIALEVVLLVSKGNGINSFTPQTADEHTGIYLLIKSSIDLVSIGELINFVALVDKLHRVETSMS